MIIIDLIYMIETNIQTIHDPHTKRVIDMARYPIYGIVEYIIEKIFLASYTKTNKRKLPVSKTEIFRYLKLVESRISRPEDDWNDKDLELLRKDPKFQEIINNGVPVYHEHIDRLILKSNLNFEPPKKMNMDMFHKLIQSTIRYKSLNHNDELYKKLIKLLKTDEDIIVK